MTTLSERINKALELTGTRKVDLARAIEVKPQVIQFLCNSKTRASRYTFEIAAALGLNIEWLAMGKGDIFTSSYHKEISDQQYRKIPILNHNQILNNLCNESNSEDIPSIIIDEKSHDTYCTEVTDNSMTPLLMPSSLVIFKKYNPEDALINNSIVICKIPEMNTVLIRELIITNDKKILTPQNIAIYNKLELTQNISIIGIVFENRWTIKQEGSIK